MADIIEKGTPAYSVKTDSKNDDHMVVTTEVGTEIVLTDGVWGDIAEGATNYRTLGWLSASVIEIKVQIGLGVLALPYVLSTLGMVPGILVVACTGIMAFWTQWQIGTIKKIHPEVFSLADVGFVMFGPVGREIFGAVFWLFLTVIAGTAMVGISTALNALSLHATCTAAFVVVAAVITMLLSSVQTLEKVSWFSWVGAVCIMVSIITLLGAVSRQERPGDAPRTGPWDKNVVVIGHPSFIDAMNAVATVFLSYAGGPYYFNVVAELKNPRDYPKSITLSSIFTAAAYLIIGSLTYHYCGQYVSSPALGSAGSVMKRVCYGLAMPGLIVSAVLNTHISAKYLFVRLMRNSHHLTQHTKTHYMSWFGCIAFNGTISFIIAESIPVFNDLVSVAGAILGTPCAYTAPLMMWFYVKRHDLRTPGKRTVLLVAVAVVNAILLLCSIFVAIGGLYSSIIAIRDSLKAGTVGGVFSCADNSNSV